VALLVFVAVVGSVGYGVLALGAYGVGLASPIVLGGLAFTMLPARSAARLRDWLAARSETIHLTQGVLFAFLGGLIVTYFAVRYVVPPPA
jgi:cytochrome c biogenesis protein CcdA